MQGGAPRRQGAGGSYLRQAGGLLGGGWRRRQAEAALDHTTTAAPAGGRGGGVLASWQRHEDRHAEFLIAAGAVGSCNPWTMSLSLDSSSALIRALPVPTSAPAVLPHVFFPLSCASKHTQPRAAAQTCSYMSCCAVAGQVLNILVLPYTLGKCGIQSG